MKIVPLGDNVIVRELDRPEQTAGGIVLPETVRETTVEGKVLSVGDGHRLPNGKVVPLEVHEGDTVLFSRWAGQEIELDGEKLRILREEEILARVE